MDTRFRFSIDKNQVFKKRLQDDNSGILELGLENILKLVFKYSLISSNSHLKSL